MVTLMANATMGIYSCESNGISITNYPSKQSSSCGPLISRRLIFGITLNVRKAKQIEFYGQSIPFCGNINALLKGESGKQLIGGGILDREFEFRPSFDEYLKVMELARTDQSKKDCPDAKQYRSKNGVGEEDKGDVKLGRSGRHQHQEKKYAVNGQNESFKNADGESTRKSLGREGLKDGRKQNLGQGYLKKEFAENVRSLVRGQLDDQGRNVDVKVKTKLLADTTNGRQLKYRTPTRVPQLESTVGIKEKNPGKLMSFGAELVHERNRIQHKRVIGRQTAPKNKSVTTDSKNFIEVGDGIDVAMERVAFKNFDEFSDFVDKPRVSRREMEERIQKLSKWLNGADVGLPEWMFSKMMRSAKIRYTDHSILRVIQILGKLGNWRRVMQVIEWLQSRERFKSYRTRNIYTTALNAYGKARRPTEALNLFYAMQHNMSSYPDLVAYRCIAVTLGQAGHLKELFNVIDFMRSPPPKKIKKGVFEKWDPRLEPDIIVYNAVLNACVKRKQWRGAFWVWQQLKQQGLQPSSSTYGLFMEVMFECGKYSLVHEFFRILKKSSIPNALTYKGTPNLATLRTKTHDLIQHQGWKDM